ncbi:MAG: lytic murein transglycosylase, partial [Rickettsiales bacterium]|nr:lytic murein transglycosylase [Rickettsiales bacterium]
MKYIKIFLVFLCIFLSTSQNIFASGTSKHTATGFEKWVAAFREKILSGGYKISAQTFDTAFANVQFNEKVIAADKNQAEFSETFWDYYHKRITRWRVEKGREQYKKYPTLLSKIEKKYGVPGNYIIAFWGMETSYGRYFGGWNVIEALALLTYEGRREEFFERELITALQILEGGHISAEKMRGS